MNIIELVKQILTDCPLISEFTNNVHVDFTENTMDDFGVFAVGDEPIKEDILGNQTRRHSFILYANNQAASDYERLQNSSFILNLGYYLETIKGNSITAEVGSKTKQGELIKLTCANGMLYEIPTGDINDPIMYHLQIYAMYKLESED